MPLAVLCEYECYFEVSQLSPSVFGHILLLSWFVGVFLVVGFFVTRASETITSSAKNDCMYQAKLPSKCSQYEKGIRNLHWHTKLLECWSGFFHL